MTSKLPTHARTFITPLSRSDLLEPGERFPRDELPRRILSVFWLNCCSIPGLSRAPAPVVELSPEAGTSGREHARLRAWWLLYDGIVQDTDGPNSDRLALFFGTDGNPGQLWPRYQFRVSESSLEVAMTFHQDPGLHWGTCVRFETLPDGSVRIIDRQPMAFE